MSIVKDIVVSWRSPRGVVRRHLAVGQREDRILVFLILGCALVALSRLPIIVRGDVFGEGSNLGPSIGSSILAWLFIMPLVLYLLAAVSHIVVKVFGASGSWFGARLALFWAICAASPLWLINGVFVGYFGVDAASTQVVGAIALAVFAYIWLSGLYEVEFAGGQTT